MKTAEQRVEHVLPDNSMLTGFIELDGEFLESIYNDVINAEVVKKIIAALKSMHDDTVRECCDIFRKKCPSCLDGILPNESGGKDCQLCGTSLRYVYEGTGVRPL